MAAPFMAVTQPDLTENTRDGEQTHFDHRLPWQIPATVPGGFDQKSDGERL